MDLRKVFDCVKFLCNALAGVLFANLSSAEATKARINMDLTKMLAEAQIPVERLPKNAAISGEALR